MRWAIGSNAANTFFTQFVYFGSAFVLFLDRLGLDKAAVGFILSLIPLSNGFALLIAPRIARHGYKRTFVLFFGLRKLVSLPLLLTPWVVNSWGTHAALIFVATIVALFAIFRSIEETAYYPWYQEFVPGSLLGKYSAISNIGTALAGLLAVLVASFVIDRSPDLSGFMLLITAGVFMGLLSVWGYTFVPGGASESEPLENESRIQALRTAVSDANFRRYLAGLALVSLGTVPLASFLPLFLVEEIGLSSGVAVLVQLGTLSGTLLSSYLWGWAADRYGSRPVTLSGIGLLALIAFCWWIVPGNATIGLYLSFLIAFGHGVATLGWSIGSGRLLFVNIVPPEKKSDYLAIFFAWAGVQAGLSQLLGGWVLNHSQSLSGSYLGLDLGPYSPIIIGGIVLPTFSLLLFQSIRADNTMSVRQFAALFLRGNPFKASINLVRFHRGEDEHHAVLTTEQMGQTKSPLTVEELLGSLADPRFHVRFEAIVSIARTRPDPRFVDALAKVLSGNAPALGVLAAWALGRIRDERALDVLRSSLTSNYKSVQAHSVRALGRLNDRASVPVLLQRLEQEDDPGLQLAFASALGSLGAVEAASKICCILDASSDETDRLELALALGKLVGKEESCIRLWRRLRDEPYSGAAQTVSAIKKRLPKPKQHRKIADLLDQSADAFAHDDGECGRYYLCAAAEIWSQNTLGHQKIILDYALNALRAHGHLRPELLLLLLHTLSTIPFVIQPIDLLPN